MVGGCAVMEQLSAIAAGLIWRVEVRLLSEGWFGRATKRKLPSLRQSVWPYSYSWSSQRRVNTNNIR